MKKTLIRLSSAILLLVTVFTLCSFTAAASSSESIPEARDISRKYLSVSGIKSRQIGSYAKKSVYINGKAVSFGGRMINGVAYLPVKSFIENVTGAKVTYSSAQKTLTAYGNGYSISLSDGAYVLYSSDRPIFSMTPAVVLSDGNMYAPAATLSRALGVKISSSSSGISVSGKSSPIMHASKFYREDEVYWLARIINAESRGEPLIGQIAVGSVVLNRVKSPSYPNTIWSVIFDKKYGVQFSPILDGSIYAEPTYTSVLAAKICLEGFSLSDDILFFLYPGASTSSWIPKNREYAFSIGKHDFYK